MQQGRDFFVLHGTDDADETGNTGCCLKMPHIGLGGTQGTVFSIGGILSEHLGEGPDFNGISLIRPGAARFNIGKGFRVNAGFRIGLFKKFDLRL